MIHLDRFAFLAFAMSLGACASASSDEPREDTATAAATLSSGDVTSLPTDGMVLSTGNLYFTTHDITGATVYRAAQSASPGEASKLAHLAGATFGDIVFAQDGAEFFAYFLETDAEGSTIRKASLAPPSQGPVPGRAHARPCLRTLLSTAGARRRDRGLARPSGTAFR